MTPSLQTLSQEIKDPLLAANNRRVMPAAPSTQGWSQLKNPTHKPKGAPTSLIQLKNLILLVQTHPKLGRIFPWHSGRSSTFPVSQAREWGDLLVWGSGCILPGWWWGRGWWDPPGSWSCRNDRGHHPGRWTPSLNPAGDRAKEARSGRIKKPVVLRVSPWEKMRFIFLVKLKRFNKKTIGERDKAKGCMAGCLAFSPEHTC